MDEVPAKEVTKNFGTNFGLIGTCRDRGSYSCKQHWTCNLSAFGSEKFAWYNLSAFASQKCLQEKHVWNEPKSTFTSLQLSKSGSFAQMVGKSTAGACSAEALCPNLPSSSGAGFTCSNLLLSSRPVSMLAHSAALSGCDKSPPKSSQDMHMPMAEHRLRGRARACTLQLML